MIVGKPVRVFKETYNTLAGYCDIDSVRTALEAYEQSKWVEFDINNPATYPQAGTHAFRYIVRTTNGVQKITIIAHWNGRYWFANQQDIDVTHWQYLPEFKE